MTVIVLERVPVSLRGQLSRWMLEVRAGVFVGTLSVRVRERLWELVRKRCGKGSAVLIARAANEQGFSVASHGDAAREVFDNEGLWLVRERAR